MAEERLQKIIAAAGLCSRRQAEKLIAQGRVRVDGKTVSEMGVKVDPGRRRITVDNKPLPKGGKKIFILLNKPKGVVTTMSDPQGRPTVSSLVRKKISTRLFPVGRLDIDTEGALILTNDGDTAQRILHPKYEIDRTYLVIAKGKIGKEKIERLEKGVEIEGRTTWPARVEVRETGGKQSKLHITIHEGRKRQVRRMCAAVGHPVVALRRIAYGGLPLGSLPVGRYRPLDAADLARIFTPFGPPGRSPGG